MYDVRMYYPGKPRNEVENAISDKRYGQWASGFGDGTRDIAFDIESIDVLRDLISYLPLDGTIVIKFDKENA